MRSRTEEKTIPAGKRVYQDIKAAILSGLFSPEERLTEEHLAERLGVSRTPVREALSRLEAEGLVQLYQRRGFIVSRQSREEIEELFEIRAILEGYALRVISGKITDSITRRLEECVEKAEAALGAGRMNEVFRWNTRFHDILHQVVADSARLYRMIVDMRKQVLRYRKETLQTPEGARRTIDGHRRLLLALRLQDADLCERTMREHIRQSKEDALQTLMATQREENGE